MVRGQHRGAFTVDGVEGPRFELALDRLRAGHAFEFQDVAFQIGADGALTCVVDSSWDSDNVTASTATADLEGAVPALAHLVEFSPSFAAIVGSKPVRWELVEDDGMGSVLICTKIGESARVGPRVSPRRRLTRRRS